MISATLWNSAFYFASLLSFVTIALRVPLGVLVFAGAAGFIALLCSGLAMSVVPHDLVDDRIIGTVVRMLPFLTILALFNINGDHERVIMQTFWLWALLELIFVLNWGQVPELRDYLRAHMPFYIAGPWFAAFILRVVRLPSSAR